MPLPDGLIDWSLLKYT